MATMLPVFETTLGTAKPGTTLSSAGSAARELLTIC